MKPEKLEKWMKQNAIKEDDLKNYHTEVGIPSNVCILYKGPLKSTMIMPVHTFPSNKTFLFCQIS